MRNGLKGQTTDEYCKGERYEAGCVVEGWEVKALRAGHVQLKESYVIVRDGEIWIIGMHISPLPTASTHIHPNATRTRKLLLKAEEISKRSEEHTSELQSLMRISYAVFCLKKQNKTNLQILNYQNHRLILNY